MVFADVVDVDKPDFFSAGLRNDNGIRADAYRSVPRSTSTTMQRASTIGSQGSVGVQAMVQSDQLCGEVEASQVSSAHQAATRRCSNEWDQQTEAVILVGCGDFVRDTNQCRGALLFGISVLALTRHRPRSMSQCVVDGLLKVYQ